MYLRTIIRSSTGLFTRLLLATKILPRELLNVSDRADLQLAINEAVDVGADPAIVVIHSDKMAFRDDLKRNQNDIGRLDGRGKTMLGAALAVLQVPEMASLKFEIQNGPLGLGRAISRCSAMVLAGHSA